MSMDWLCSHSTVRDTTWQITVTDVSLLVTPINPCSAQSILILPLILMLPFIATLQLQKKEKQKKKTIYQNKKYIQITKMNDTPITATHHASFLVLFFFFNFFYQNCLSPLFNLLTNVQTVLLFSPTCFFIRMRQTSYRGFSRKSKRN